ncbi:hypothetical protein RUND412_004797 [Rhizina undulata]
MRPPLLSALTLSTIAPVSARRQLTIPNEISGVYTNSMALGNYESKVIDEAGNADPFTAAVLYVKELFPDAEFRSNNDMYIDDDTGITHMELFYPPDLPLCRGKLVHPPRLAFTLEALKGAVAALQLPLKEDLAEAVPESSSDGASSQSFVIMGTEGAVSEPRANLAYFQMSEGLKLVWKIETYLDEKWLVIYANAQEKGDIIGVIDYVADAA